MENTFLGEGLLVSWDCSWFDLIFMGLRMDYWFEMGFIAIAEEKDWFIVS